MKLEELAPYVGKILPGIDWNALAAKNANTVYKVDYFYDYMLPAFEKADVVRETLQLTPAKDLPQDQAVSAWKMALKTMDKISGNTKSAASQGRSFVDLANAFRMPVEAYRILIGACWYTALYGATLHRTGAIHWAGVQWAKDGMSEQEVEARIVQHAVLVTTMFQGLAKLDEAGVLGPIKRPGLGAVQIPLVIAGVVVIVVVAAIFTLGWLIIAMKSVSDRNRETEKNCAHARATGDPNSAALCKAALDDPSSGPGTSPFGAVSEALTTIVWVGAVAMGGYALFMLWPAISQQLASRSATRAATRAA